MAKTTKSKNSTEVEIESKDSSQETLNVPETQEEMQNPLSSMSNDELLSGAKAQLLKSKIFFNEIQNTRYPIDMSSKAMSFIKKYLEKDAPWDAKTSGGLLALYGDLKGVNINQEVVELKHSSVSNLYNFLLGFKGNGYFEAREYIKILTIVGDSIQRAMENIDKKNKEYQDIHKTLSEFDDELQLRGLKIDEEEINQMFSDSTKEPSTNDSESLITGEDNMKNVSQE